MNFKNHPKKLLVVDDNKVFRNALSECLKAAGHSIVEAENGKQAQALLGIKDFSTVISDVSMVPINGIELLHYVKRVKPTIPVILMTGFSELAETQEAISLGAHGLLAKPFKEKELLKILDSIFSGSDKEAKERPLDDEYSQISKSKKLNFMKHTAEVLLEQIYSDQINKEDFENAKTVVETTLEIITDSEDLFDMLEILNSHADFLYAHSLGVSLYGVMIARELKWHSPATLAKIAMSGLFHDIGKKEIDRALLIKARVDLSSEEIRLMETHPVRGIEILGENRFIPSDVLQTVLQHHENCLGTGYPAALSRNHIHPFARLIAVANEFCNMVIKNPQSSKMPFTEAIQRMFILYSEYLDSVFLNALARLFQLVPPTKSNDERFER